MKILELCHFSAGGCGVWTRAREESIRLSKLGHEVKVFSSNFVKGSDEIAPKNERVGKVEITRFPAKHLGGEAFFYWNCKKEALDFSPDIIFTHNYRQYNTHLALHVAKKLRKSGKKCKVFLVTHAPFVEGDITRSFIAKRIVGFYDKFIGQKTLNKFDKILTISGWEIPCLMKCGAHKNKIVYIPNGIPEEFFRQKKLKEEHKILFLGRIAPKKKLETLIEAIPLINDKKIKFEIVGPEEKNYFNMLKKLVAELKLNKRINFSPPVFDIKEKIKKIDSAKIYVLPSRVEGMPQSLIEAMAREKIVIGSDSIAIRDLIIDGKNGHLFEFDNPKDLAEKIDLALSVKNKSMQKNARKSVEQFSWDKIIIKIEKLISS
ncbi:glycosyltransferase family 4 protein [Candidatus Pacearchaeota archaeon]|nr:glycosyltransferase family 4 protein [Candidatus Pacearchaeota archaeon]